MKEYKTIEEELAAVFEPESVYLTSGGSQLYSIMEIIRKGIHFTRFLDFAEKSPFSLGEWSKFLHLSERSMQRYKKENKSFEPLQSEKILEIAFLYNKGVQIFGSKLHFDKWLDAENIALGRIKPKDLLDNSFGIQLLKDELIRIEHGVFA
jgi:putative toxin-antitoxin system antitoxin component (TIGR02293 family)